MLRDVFRWHDCANLSEPEACQGLHCVKNLLKSLVEYGTQGFIPRLLLEKGKKVISYDNNKVYTAIPLENNNISI